MVVDEAYVDFANEHCIGLVREFPNLIVTRSFSKGYSMAGIRLGYLVAQPEIVDQLMKVKDSYNCDALSLTAGVAALKDQEHLEWNRARILSTRRRLTERLRALGFTVPESQANFVWATGGPPAAETFQRLKNHRILVRLMSYPGFPPGLRISIGTDLEIDQLLEVLGSLS
jgi:histidinol-phosphate aminotransferase